MDLVYFLYPISFIISLAGCIFWIHRMVDDTGFARVMLIISVVLSLFPYINIGFGFLMFGVGLVYGSSPKKVAAS